MKLSHENFEAFTEVLRKSTDDLCPSEIRDIAHNITAFREVLIQESDRGCALMAVAYIDELLIGLLKSHFVDDDTVSKRVLGSGGSLDSFASRVDMAYLLGLLPKNVVNDLNILRKIRNDFAHVSKPMSFEDDGLRSRCFALQVMPFPKNLAPRSRFCRSMVIAANEIEFARLDTTKCTPRTDYDGNRTAESLAEINKFVKENFNIDLLDSK
ncbi:hypothetical protein [Vibrio diazotrophicus]|uniref:hypothetical protein n=1 Tax=Vibrio diazotrophicus TaxID=685 RepID=UPI000C9DE5C8|nr:hypothetical protein [Vibrio diazotrophicus]PNH95079.1 hypothetical protein C1M59_03315 [Vibrio diazotrophicus]